MTAEKIALVVLVVLVAVAVLAQPPRVSRRVHGTATIGVLVLTPVLLAIDLWHGTQLVHLRHHPLFVVAGALALVVVVGALALLFARRAGAMPLMVVFALPFRLPISVGGSTVNLLVPLYVVIVAGVLAQLLARHAAEPPAREQLRRGPITGRRAIGAALSPSGLEWLLIASVALYAVQATYSGDFSKALENVVFFYVPFALLFGLLRGVEWNREILLGCLALAVALAVVFAGVGFIEYERQQLFLNPKLVQANQYGNYFRVNSVFFDPNIYGRFLATVMIALAVVLLQARTRRAVLAVAVVLLWLWGALLTSLSESSMAALLLGLTILAAWRWDTMTILLVAIAVLVLGAAVALVAPPSAHLGLSGEGTSANNATSGRANLVSGGLSLFADRPLEGYGSGSFALQYRLHHRTTEEVSVSASHTIPITIAAEQGIAGIALYLLTLMSAFTVLLRDVGRSPPRIAVAACFAALMLHTWAYADLFEDPTTWTLLAIGVALARFSPRASGAPAFRWRLAARPRSATPA
jgi:O-antigen ligase